jgi:hypothetical protein
MPRLSDTMTEGKVAKWHKNVGDTVKEGDILAEIETDKAVQDFESEFNGTLLYQGVEEGMLLKLINFSNYWTCRNRCFCYCFWRWQKLLLQN